MEAITAVKWTPALPPSREPYRVFLKGHGWVLAVQPQAVKFDGYEGYDLFSHKEGNGYRVSERLTGLAVTSDGDTAATFLTRGEALGAASADLGKISPAQFDRTILSVLQKRAAGDTNRG